MKLRTFKSHAKCYPVKIAKVSTIKVIADYVLARFRNVLGFYES